MGKFFTHPPPPKKLSSINIRNDLRCEQKVSSQLTFALRINTAVGTEQVVDDGSWKIFGAIWDGAGLDDSR